MSLKCCSPSNSTMQEPSAVFTTKSKGSGYTTRTPRGPQHPVRSLQVLQHLLLRVILALSTGKMAILRAQEHDVTRTVTICTDEGVRGVATQFHFGDGVCRVPEHVTGMRCKGPAERAILQAYLVICFHAVAARVRLPSGPFHHRFCRVLICVPAPNTVERERLFRPGCYHSPPLTCSYSPNRRALEFLSDYGQSLYQVPGSRAGGSRISVCGGSSRKPRVGACSPPSGGPGEEE